MSLHTCSQGSGLAIEFFRLEAIRVDSVTSDFIPIFSTANADYIVRHLPEIRKVIGKQFDVNKLFSNDQIFSNLGKILCGRPFPRSSNIRFVDNVLYSPDYNGADKDELDVMPSEF